MKTKEKERVLGKEGSIFICNNCEEKLANGEGSLHWEKEDFTLCFECLEKLYKEVYHK